MTITTPQWKLALLVGVTILILMMSVNRQAQFNVANVSVTDAKQMIDEGAIIVDVRGEKQYGGRHIPGAILITLEVLRHGIPSILPADKAKRIVVYCNDGLNHGPEGTALLNKAGYVNAVNIEHGIEGWEKAGLPLQKKAT